MSRQKKPLEAVSGTYSAIPHAVLDSVAFTGASHPAKALLIDLVRQLNGRNNGRLQLSDKWLKGRGWTSKAVTFSAKRALLERKLIMLAKQGGLNHGASWYLVTWLAVSNFEGLDITAMDYHPGAWSFMDKLPLPKNASAVPSNGVVKHSTAPRDGVAKLSTTPPDGAREALLKGSTTPPDGDNVYHQYPPVKSSRPIVGKKRTSAPENTGRPA
ncbi:MAG: hypothetical protein V4446_13640 [Pseudomonadota bacterium]